MKIAAGLVLVGVSHLSVVAAQDIPEGVILLDSITVTRSPDALLRAPQAAALLDLRRNVLQSGLGPDEVLPLVPGILVANRYNPSLDQRISIRGSGARAPFGVRGLTVLLDGIPQTLPDGQSQLNNVDWGMIERVEVLRGGNGALYGNAAGGVISLHSRKPAAPLEQDLMVEAGSDNLLRLATFTGVRSGNSAAALAASRVSGDGFRQHNRSENIRLRFGATHDISPALSLTLHAAHADAPLAENPGALTAVELVARRDSAAANNIVRNAGKSVDQQQLGFTLDWRGANGTAASATVFGLHRDLRNPLPVDVLLAIDREVGGVRLHALQSTGSGTRAPVLGVGLDLQTQRDKRRNTLSLDGAITDSILVDQDENTTALGLFTSVSWSAAREWQLEGAVRYDHTSFAVSDKTMDGTDDSGERTLGALSGSIGVSFALAPELVAWARVGTSFETPTTTELVNSPDGSGGFSQTLEPQRSITWEIGTRGMLFPAVSYDLTGYMGRTRDAIVPFEEVGGRSFFTNAGRIRSMGMEAGIVVERKAWSIRAAYTWSHLRFDTYRLRRGSAVDTLDGLAVPGTPEHYLRIDATSRLPGGIHLRLEHSVSSEVVADDANTITAGGWGIGITTLRAGYEFMAGEGRILPFFGVHNLFDRDWIASVTPNGFGGRVFEPGPGRTWLLGARITWLR